MRRIIKEQQLCFNCGHPKILPAKYQRTHNGQDKVMRTIQKRASSKQSSKFHFTSRNHEKQGKGGKRGMTGGGCVCNHTNTTRSHIGGNHDRALAGFEFVEDPVALVLLFVAVNR